MSIGTRVLPSGHILAGMRRAGNQGAFTWRVLLLVAGLIGMHGLTCPMSEAAPASMAHAVHDARAVMGVVAVPYADQYVHAAGMAMQMIEAEPVAASPGHPMSDDPDGCGGHCIGQMEMCVAVLVFIAVLALLLTCAFRRRTSTPAASSSASRSIGLRTRWPLPPALLTPLVILRT